jgi:hypothetical protein
MARARNIKPGFFANEDLAECSPWARLCFAGLWTLADREGRLEDRPKRIKGELFRFDTVDVEPLLQELARFKFIVRYEVDGDRFIAIPEFKTHQTPHYSEKQSVIKPPQLQEKTTHIEPKDSRSTPRKEPPSRGGRNPLNPDSLNPDSPIPEEEKPSASSSAERTGTPTIPCPYGAIVDAYHAALPMLAKVRLRDGKTWAARQKAMRSLWGWVLSSKRSDGTRRAETADQALEWLASYFERAKDNDFLMGRTQRSGEHANWRCDFDFLLTDRGMKQVIEKTQEHAA